MKTKICSICGDKKKVNEFRKANRGIYGVSRQCKQCIKQKRKEDYKNKKDLINKKRRTYYKRNTSKILNRNRKWYKKNETLQKARQKLYRSGVKHKIRNRVNKWQAKNKNRVTNYKRKYQNKSISQLSNWYVVEKIKRQNISKEIASYSSIIEAKRQIIKVQRILKHKKQKS